MDLLEGIIRRREPGNYNVTVNGFFSANTFLIEGASGTVVAPQDIALTSVLIKNADNNALRIQSFPANYLLQDIFVDSINGDGIIVEGVDSCLLRSVFIEECSLNDLVISFSYVKFVDGNLDTAKISLSSASSSLERFYSLYLTVLSVDSTFLKDVAVTIKDQDDSTIFAGYTDSSFTLGPIDLPVFVKTSDTLIEFGPFNLQLSYYGYDTTIEISPTAPVYMTVVLQGQSFIRGDVNADGNVNVSDAAYLLSHLLPYPDFPCRDAADVNDDGSNTITDASYLLSNLLPAPQFPPPNLECGPDPTPDSLQCESFPPCGSKFGVSSLAEGAMRGCCSLVEKDVKIVKDTLYVDLELRNSMPIAGFQFTLSFDPNAVEVIGYEWLVKDPSEIDFSDDYVDTAGKYYFVTLYSLVPGIYKSQETYWVPGQRDLLRLKFKIKRSNVEIPSVEEAVFTDPEGTPYEFTKEDVFSTIMSSSDSRKGGLQVLNAPNPFQGELYMRLIIPESGEVVVALYDVTGRKVRTLLEKQVQSGEYILKWDGRDDNGREVSSGVYIYKIRLNGRLSRWGKIARF